MMTNQRRSKVVRKHIAAALRQVRKLKAHVRANSYRNFLLVNVEDHLAAARRRLRSAR